MSGLGMAGLLVFFAGSFAAPAFAAPHGCHATVQCQDLQACYQRADSFAKAKVSASVRPAVLSNSFGLTMVGYVVDVSDNGLKASSPACSERALLGRIGEVPTDLSDPMQNRLASLQPSQRESEVVVPMAPAVAEPASGTPTPSDTGGSPSGAAE